MVSNRVLCTTNHTVGLAGFYGVLVTTVTDGVMCTFIDKSQDFFTKMLFFNSKEICGSWCRIESAPTLALLQWKRGT